MELHDAEQVLSSFDSLTSSPTSKVSAEDETAFEQYIEPYHIQVQVHPSIGMQYQRPERIP